MIHSLDRPFAARRARQGSEEGPALPVVYVQVNIGDEEQKGGCAIADVGDLVAAVRASPLPLAGLMAIPPLESSPRLISRCLPSLAGVMTSWPQHGHVGRFRAAVMLGATAVRVGTAIFEDSN